MIQRRLLLPRCRCYPDKLLPKGTAATGNNYLSALQEQFMQV